MRDGKRLTVCERERERERVVRRERVLRKKVGRERVCRSTASTLRFGEFCYICCGPFPEVSDLAMRVLNSIAYKSLALDEEATDMSHRRNFNQNKMRAAVQAPSAEFTSPNREDRMKLIDLQRQLQEQVFMSCMQKSRIQQLEKELLQKEALPVKTEDPRRDQENHQADLNRQHQEQLAINLKQKRRLKETVEQKEALELKVEKLQKELDERSEENLQVQELKHQLHKSEETNDRLLHINKVLKWKVQDLENVVQHKEALQNKVGGLQKELTEARELNEVRQKQLQKEQEEKQDLQNKLLSVESALAEEKKTARGSYEQTPQCGRKTDEEATNKLLSVEFALTEQKKTAEEAKNKLLRVDSALMEEKNTAEETKQKLLSVQSALTEEKQAAEAAREKASELEECLNIERTRVQVLQGDLDTQKITFKAVLEKSSCAQHALGKPWSTFVPASTGVRWECESASIELIGSNRANKDTAVSGGIMCCEAWINECTWIELHISHTVSLCECHHPLTSTVTVRKKQPPVPEDLPGTTGESERVKRVKAARETGQSI
ncbi:hypothetical protein WMY93_005695 [Mugilogobius chulae]|uniref:Uncharacterized protein n=1 Tax=Mugilogobius chulae TaxID=88201 RepID=A0AAW0PHX8_9GOBI